MKAQLDQLYTSFNHPESAFDPIQVVRRYDRLDDREIVAFVAAGLAFGRVASVVQSIEAVCRVMGPIARRSRTGRGSDTRPPSPSLPPRSLSRSSWLDTARAA